MPANTIVATGNSSVEKTSRLGLDNASAEKTPNTSAMQEPAPTSAASTDAANTSFKRIREGSLNWFGAKCPSLELVGEKTPPRITQGRTIRGADCRGSDKQTNG